MFKIIEKTCNFKEIIAFLFLSFFFVKANAQPKLVEYNGAITPHFSNDFVVISDTKIPIYDGKCRKLVSEITHGKNGTWSRYHFVEAPLTGPWYKDFVFLKLLTPDDTYFGNRRAVFDVANNRYWHFIDYIDNKIYMHLIPEVPVCNDNFYLFDYTEGFPNMQYMSVFYKKKELFLSQIEKDGLNMCTFLEKSDPNRTPVYYYKFSNADYINDMIPDNDVNTEANYLFLQRDYKLNQTYNTVVFPVDVPIKDFHHIYNDGKNRMMVYRLDAVESNSLHFVRDISGVLKANTPYIIKSENNDGTVAGDVLSEYYLSEDSVDHYDINCIKQLMSSNGVRVYAQYKQSVTQYSEYIDPSEEIFIVSNNKLVNCKKIEEATVKRFRWYIKRDAQSSSIPMTMTFDGTTDINSCEAETPSNDDIYDLNGCKVGSSDNINSLAKGYYIINGKVRFVSD